MLLLLVLSALAGSLVKGVKTKINQQNAQINSGLIYY